MARGKVKISWIVDRKARIATYKKRVKGLEKKTKELTTLCDLKACLMLYSPDDKKVVTWPPENDVKSLFDKYFSLPPNVRNVKALDQESYISENIKRIGNQLADIRKVIIEYEMNDLMSQLQAGRPLYDLTENEGRKLISYANREIVSLERGLRCRKNCNPTSVNEPSPLEDETAMPSNVEPELGGIGSYATGRNIGECSKSGGVDNA